MTLYVFLRHAESVANVGGWLSGWDDVPLTARGEAQAAAAAAVLEEVQATHGTRLRRCLVSDLGRARHTAALAAPGLVPQVLADLRERHMGLLQGVDIATTKADGRYDRHMRPWTVGPPGGESHVACARRGLACLRAWHDGTPTLVVAHGSLLRNLVGLVDGLSPDEIGQGPPAGHATPMARWVEALPWPDERA